MNNLNINNNYDGPKINKKNFKKKFCVNFLPTNGFIKAEYKSIVDGDTAFFIVNGINECVRFMVVDAPSFVKGIEPFGKEATEYVDTLLKNAKEIYLESDKANNLRDDTLSERLLAWIWVDGKLLNYMLVRNGFATNKYILNENMKYLSFMRRAYKKAEQEKLNIHSIKL